jgi:hypothetical protein
MSTGFSAHRGIEFPGYGREKSPLERTPVKRESSSDDFLKFVAREFDSLAVRRCAVPISLIDAPVMRTTLRDNRCAIVRSFSNGGESRVETGAHNARATAHDARGTGFVKGSTPGYLK